MKTTINMHREILDKITVAAKTLGITRTELIVMLLKKVMANMSKPGRLGMLVSYQDRAKRDDWHRFHVRIREDDYEYCLDLRKLLKMSVSKILHYAVKKYLKKNFNKNSGDNYRFINYVISREIIQNVICWKFMWGYPPTMVNCITGS
jgi:hypothetical protein